MAIKKVNIGGLDVVLDAETNQVLDCTPTEEYKERKQKITEEILDQNENFKSRGASVIKKGFLPYWLNLVDNFQKERDTVWYNGACLEASLQVMEKLSQNVSVEEAYSLIDVQNNTENCVYFGMELSGWQSNTITGLVGSYHERGEEFVTYRNEYVNKATEEAPKVNKK